ncbi:MAG TPA: glycosyltransferase family 2 protein [Acidobacteriota bacterium]|nr:glycosyltransferase family 2 protein [Acidobacteriota bacterium]
MQPLPGADRQARGGAGGAAPLLTPRVAAVVPALDEEASVGRVIAGLPRPPVTRVVVCDNGSTDATADVARAAGAEVVHEPRRGYGAACLRALRELASDPPSVVLFVDADLSDDPSDAASLLAPLLDGTADLAIGSRVLGEAEPGALTPVQRFGNWLAAGLLRRLYGTGATDLGPFRAIRWDALQALEMRDRDFGWTVEMQVKAARRRLRTVEVPVRYRRRVGRSKISGTIRGSFLAGTKILGTIAADYLRHGPPRPARPVQPAPPPGPPTDRRAG